MRLGTGGDAPLADEAKHGRNLETIEARTMSNYRFIFSDHTVIDLEFRTVEAAQRHADYVKARFYAL